MSLCLSFLPWAVETILLDQSLVGPRMERIEHTVGRIFPCWRPQPQELLWGGWWPPSAFVGEAVLLSAACSTLRLGGLRSPSWGSVAQAGAGGVSSPGCAPQTSPLYPGQPGDPSHVYLYSSESPPFSMSHQNSQIAQSPPGEQHSAQPALQTCWEDDQQHPPKLWVPWL